MAAPLGPRLTLFETQVLAKLDTIIANQGASNAAVLALVVQGLFSVAERGLLPRGLQPQTGH